MFKWLLILSTVVSMEMFAVEKKVLALSGSLREQSTNKKLMIEAVELARNEGAFVQVIDLRDFAMPFYDGDVEEKEGMPLKAKELRKLMEASDVIIIASPEYNSSVSGVLKNTLDWASRGETGGSSRSAFKGKKFVLLSTSPGRGGGARGLASLKGIIENIGGEVVGPSITVPDGYNAFNEQGKLTNTDTKANIKQNIQQALK